MDIVQFKELPIMGILRGIEDEALEPLVETVISAGLKTIEITMNTKGAAGLIRRAVALGKGRLTVGAGTVLDIENFKAARDAGAAFIVTPVLVPEVMTACAQDRVPVFPGALTPREIWEAWQAGATMIKVFPSSFFGPVYFKEIKGPFDRVELLACGGVKPENLGEYFAAGASAVSFGASVFKKEWLAAGDFAAVGRSIAGYIRGYGALSRF